LTGTNPFDGRQPTEIFCKILTVDAPPVSSMRQDVPTALDAVIARALDRDLDKRYKTAAELARALRAMLSRSDDVVADELAQQLQRDFLEMPAKLGLDSLTQREQAWRSTSMRADVQPLASMAPSSAAQGGNNADQAAASSPKAPPRVSASQAAFSGQVRAGASPSTSRTLLVAAAAGIAGAVAVLVAWLVLERDPPVQERMVVIAKEAALPQQALAQLPAAASDRETNEPTALAPATAPSQPAETAAPTPAPPAPAQPTRPSAPDAQALSRTFARKQQLVQACFAKHAKAQEQLAGLTLHFQVAATGLVESARVQPEPLSEAPLGRCLIAVAKGTRFGALSKHVSFHIPISAEKVPRPGS
jgi:serine/threonine-protein kinase